MDVTLLQKPLTDVSTELLAIPIGKGQLSSSVAVRQIDTRLRGQLTSLIRQERFTGEMGQSLLLSTFGKIKAARVVLIGLGDRTTLSLDGWRKASAQTVVHARALRIKDVACMFPTETTFTFEELLSTATEGVMLSGYAFHAYKGKGAAHKPSVLKKAMFVLDKGASLVAARKVLTDAKAMCEAVMLARDLVNTPSAHMYPRKLVEAAQHAIENSPRITSNVLSAQDMKALGMEAALSIGQGSLHEAVGVHMTYTPSKPSIKRIVLIGKAVTFDSGGLSIKPADGMMTMKMDMAGSAAVIGVFAALAKLDVPFEVHGIFLAVENMPSGSAIRPGDVVTAMNGKTIEILNTDAEGRVTLADALAYGCTLSPDIMIDLATLTGACVVALGDDVAAVMSNTPTLGAALLDAARTTGEPLWELPLYAPYTELIRSKVADIKNVTGRHGGAITAGLFLQQFVDPKIAWAHLDIAGPAYAERETRPDLPYGGTGYGVRLLLRYLQSLSA